MLFQCLLCKTVLFHVLVSSVLITPTYKWQHCDSHFVQLSQSHKVSKDCTRIHTHVSVLTKPDFKDMNSALLSILVLFVDAELLGTGVLPVNSW